MKLVEEKLPGSLPTSGLASSIEPLSYFLQLGGKRIRPVLVMLGYKCFKEDYESVIDQALAIELFHNFTLVHDDIMDDAPIRRGQPTVHEKWNQDVAILSGDLLMIQAYDHLSRGLANTYPEVHQVFNDVAREVCYGQQLDMEFENRSDVSVDEYIEMIRLKTSVLLGAALKIGAICGGASAEQASLVYNFGVSLGVAFQIHDDRLDLYGDTDKLGKQQGGDVLANKKTILSLSALELSSDKAALAKVLFSASDTKVADVKSAFDELGIHDVAVRKAKHYHDIALSQLEELKQSGAQVTELELLAEYLMNREF